jgi:hypothetical protein
MHAVLVHGIGGRSQMKLPAVIPPNCVFIAQLPVGLERFHAPLELNGKEVLVREEKLMGNKNRYSSPA